MLEETEEQIINYTEVGHVKGFKSNSVQLRISRLKLKRVLKKWTRYRRIKVSQFNNMVKEAKAAKSEIPKLLRQFNMRKEIARIHRLRYEKTQRARLRQQYITSENIVLHSDVESEATSVSSAESSHYGKDEEDIDVQERDAIFVLEDMEAIGDIDDKEEYLSLASISDANIAKKKKALINRRRISDKKKMNAKSANENESENENENGGSDDEDVERKDDMADDDTEKINENDLNYKPTADSIARKMLSSLIAKDAKLDREKQNKYSEQFSAIRRVRRVALLHVAKLKDYKADVDERRGPMYIRTTRNRYKIYADSVLPLLKDLGSCGILEGKIRCNKEYIWGSEIDENGDLIVKNEMVGGEEVKESRESRESGVEEDYVKIERSSVTHEEKKKNNDENNRNEMLRKEIEKQRMPSNTERRGNSIEEWKDSEENNQYEVEKEEEKEKEKEVEKGKETNGQIDSTSDQIENNGENENESDDVLPHDAETIKVFSVEDSSCKLVADPPVEFDSYDYQFGPTLRSISYTHRWVMIFGVMM